MPSRRKMGTTPRAPVSANFTNGEDLSLIWNAPSKGGMPPCQPQKVTTVISENLEACPRVDRMEMEVAAAEVAVWEKEDRRHKCARFGKIAHTSLILRMVTLRIIQISAQKGETGVITTEEMAQRMATMVGATMIGIAEVVAVVMIVTGDVTQTVKFEAFILLHAKK
mmetsp:Transcript_40481/g.59594  ORF Transcript_40481/g.59594 Transcript_40481/m.59594 type:complete len:167 (-) Transcript_40481:16-516(-)